MTPTPASPLRVRPPRASASNGRLVPQHPVRSTSMRHRQQGRQFRAWLQVERLEDRNLLSAGGLGENPVPLGAAPDGSPLAEVALLPNDPSFDTQYALNNTGQSSGKVDADLDAPEAWNV